MLKHPAGKSGETKGGIFLRRILSILTMAVVVVVMGLLAAAPVMAQVGNEFDDQESESGGIGTETEISVQGSNNSQCAGLAQVGQSGNFSNMQGTDQYDNPESEQEFEGQAIEFGPEQAAECEQQIQQAAAASSAAPKKEEKKAEAKPAPKEEKKEEKKELPKSGGNGSASLLALGAGALLVGGGLLARRFVR